MGIGRKAIISEVTIKTYPNSAIERFQDALNQRVVGLLDDRRERQVDRYGGRIELLKIKQLDCSTAPKTI